MDKLDLNLEHYTVDDLEDLFSLSHKNYDVTVLAAKKKHMCDNVFGDASLANDSKAGIYQFLEGGFERLMLHIQPVVGGANGAVVLPQNAMKHAQNGHYIIENRARDGVAASASTGLVIDQQGAPPGVLNPIKYQTIKRAINIDTRFRANYFTSKSTDLQITLPTKVEKVVNMRLASVEIPMTFYAVSDSQANNVFKVSWKSSGNPAGVYDSSAVIIVPDGNYGSCATDSSATHIETGVAAVLAASPAGSSAGALKLRYVVDRISGKSRFVQDAAASVIPFKVNFNVTSAGVISSDATNPLPMTLGWLLGYRGAEYESLGGVSAPVISEGICYVQGPRYIFLAVDDYNNSTNNYFASAFSSSVIAPNILARINVAAMCQNSAMYNLGHDDGLSTQLNRSRHYFGPVDIQRLRVTLYDEYGRVVNLNNMDWSLALTFECVYE